jgi:ornithine cyclodeaminase/alanine dehydrogenase-like protein (mu-crystallin family)
LTREDLQRVVDFKELVADLRSAMAGYREGGPARRVRARVSETVTSMVLAPGLATDVPAYTVKVHAKTPSRQPALTGLICLFDLHSGDLLAVMDSGWLTAVRTAAGAVLGTCALARPDATAVGVIGAGVQGRAQLRALTALRRLEIVHVHDPDHRATERILQMCSSLDIPVRVHPSAKDVADRSEIVLMATWARAPLLDRSDIHPGTHITSLGADEPGKAELDDALLATSLVVTDDELLASSVLPKIETTLPRLLRDERPGRTGSEAVTVYSPVGLPLQDVVAGWHVYQRARRTSLGHRLDLEHGTRSSW